MSKIDPKKVIGCILGKAVGDAVGAPLEAKATHECTTCVKKWLGKPVLSEVKKLGTKTKRFKFGQYTDDTQLARELMISLIEREEFLPEDYARRIADAFKKDVVVGAGGTTRCAAENLNQGKSWQESGMPPPAAGNGTAMRVAPLGIWYHSDPGKLLVEAKNQSDITHTSSECTAGSAAMAFAVAHVSRIHVSEFDKEAFLEEVASAASMYDIGFAESIRELKKQTSSTILYFVNHAGKVSDKFRPWQGVSSYVVPSTLWALYSFIDNYDNYWETIKYSLVCGGDVDSTAAMAGAISGTLLGSDAIPSEIANVVNDNKKWRGLDLVRLAVEFYRKMYQLDRKSMQKYSYANVGV